MKALLFETPTFGCESTLSTWTGRWPLPGRSESGERARRLIRLLLLFETSGFS